MKKKSIKNLSLNKKSISNLHAGKQVGGVENSVRYCILSIVDQNGNNLCLTRFNCPQTREAGCVLTIEVDRLTRPIC
ncbi:hypothetical protein EZY14_002460 [Kordia sp. TARA_039_SRF]|jgi:hypothetical protein|nr:hypothetical protein EZY14_002460 [Kordia sp. TARA_039_SRF]